MIFEHTRREIAAFMRRLYRQGLTTTSGGNISVRVDDRWVLMTPSGRDKAELSPEHIVAVRLSDGLCMTPEATPTIETEMHLSIYRCCEHVRAVVHAHPPVVSAFSATQRSINCRLVAEAYAIVGHVGRVPYAQMGSKELAAAVARAAAAHACLVLDNHGALATGTTLLQAFDRLEVLEAAARITLLTTLLGEERELPPEALAGLDVLMGRAPAAQTRERGCDPKKSETTE